jgi:hypothetical protein
MDSSKAAALDALSLEMAVQNMAKRQKESLPRFWRAKTFSYYQRKFSQQTNVYTDKTNI